MNQIKLILTVIILSIIISSCEEKKIDNAIVSPQSTSVKGDLTEFISIENGNYEIADGNGGKMAVKINALKPYPDDIKKLKITFTASLLDANGMPLSGVNDFKIDYQGEEKIKTLLKNGIGQEVISFKGFFGDYKSEKYANKVKSFSVSSSLKQKKVKSKSNQTNKAVTSPTSTAKASNKWDKTLDTYSEYVDQYVVLMKKANKGDLDALSEYPSMMQKATKLNEQLKDAGNDLTPKQLKRMTAIQTKMTNALYDMQ
ncbi:DUF6591 domain-containing protein [uncultured Dokdonia sp.]|uniref:DUF6591 domain-containing protein n=1 Tax=uncultured Dokdonia sp. TaxID=575653 RepID=UPI002612E7B2|nr:DUF6591 domain-containing protein [uncultured Dokdonia sp.]